MDVASGTDRHLDITFRLQVVESSHLHCKKRSGEHHYLSVVIYLPQGSPHLV